MMYTISQKTEYFESFALLVSLSLNTNQQQQNRMSDHSNNCADAKLRSIPSGRSSVLRRLCPASVRRSVLVTMTCNALPNSPLDTGFVFSLVNTNNSRHSLRMTQCPSESVSSANAPGYVGYSVSRSGGRDGD